MSRAKALLERKQDLGRRASYRKLAEMTGTNHTSIRETLTESKSAIPINRERIMDAVEEALDELEAEEENDRAAAYAA